MKSAIFVTLLTTLICAAAFLLVGPQILLIGPLVLGAGVLLAPRKSPLALVCFGYLLSFGLVIAWITILESGQTLGHPGVWIPALCGLVGAIAIATGLNGHFLRKQIKGHEPSA